MLLTRHDVERLPVKDVLAALQRQPHPPGLVREAVELLLHRCAAERALPQAHQLHALMLATGALRSRYLSNKLVQAYGQCGDVESAHAVFARQPDPNVFSWMMLISACLRNARPRAALGHYRAMQLRGCHPDAHVVSAIFCAVADTANLELGRSITAPLASTAMLHDPVVANSLLNMYRRCGGMDDFERAFWAMPSRDEVSWTTMLAGRIQCGREASALELLRVMDQDGFRITSALTFATLVDACGNLSAIAQGRHLHDRIITSGVCIDVVLHTALLNMYAKCGRVDEARELFDQTLEPNNITFSSMVAAYARNGHFGDALKLFWSMEQDGYKPDSVTFTHVLYACSHGGFVDQAWHYFTTLEPDRGIPLVAEHFGCAVDLLARAGWLADAEKFLNRMPIPPDSVSWMSLLQACRIHRNVEIGARAAEHVFRLAPHRAGPYSLLSNIYSDAGKWDMAAKVQKLMRDRGIKKPGGRSWIEINGKTSEFIVGDSWHPDLVQICQEIQRVSKVMKEHGYVPDTKQVLHDAEEEEKEDILYFHSEKLAIGLGLIKTPPKTTISIVKNIRVCPDCHTAAKVISKVTERKIVIRDINLFHHMEDGNCSCRDYW
ncbi:hypothetical protein SELMODRAFT_96927 [Selaginella moellendorffii]|uniref:DYW domain-containing protein n=1 Tax=Selaginella moellendorffii TaxID=88036 RepID=D8RLQ6_SELML|nr:hypothetical protein SELMODRAFT_96927 [Selaginella moellendorffii]